MIWRQKYKCLNYWANFFCFFCIFFFNNSILTTFLNSNSKACFVMVFNEGNSCKFHLEINLWRLQSLLSMQLWGLSLNSTRDENHFGNLYFSCIMFWHDYPQKSRFWKFFYLVKDFFSILPEIPDVIHFWWIRNWFTE